MEQNKQSAPQNAASEAAVRRQKLADLKAAGHDPFTITKCKQDAFSADLKEEYKDLPAEEDTGRMVSLAGRMMSKRVMGKASFAHLRDAKGDIQIFVKRDLLGDEARRIQKDGCGRYHCLHRRSVPHQNGRTERARA